MNTGISKGLAIAVVAGISCLGAVVRTVSAQEAQAQTSAPSAAAEAPNQIGEIIVTAQKRSESINDVPISITAVTGDALTERGISDPADLTNIVAGFNFAKSNYGTPVYSLRGVGFYDTSLAASPAVSIYTDEVPLPFSVMTRGAAFDLERVEVLKGPQGTLFGQNSTGGAINYIVAKPTSETHAGFDVDYGSFGKVVTQAFLSGAVADDLNARFSIRHESGGAWQESDTRYATLGDADFTAARLLLDWTPSSQLSVNVNLNGWRDTSDTQAGQFIGYEGSPASFPLVAAEPVAPANDRAADWDSGSRFGHDDTFGQLSVRVNYALNDGLHLTSISSYEHMTVDTTTDADGTAAQDYTGVNTGLLETVTQELRLEGHAAADSVRWMIGGNYEHDRTDDYLLGLTADSRLPFTTSLATDLQRTDTYAGFANADWNVEDNLTLQGGVRYTDQDRTFQGCLYDTGTGQLADLQALTASALTGTTVHIPPGSCTTLGPNNLPGLVKSDLDQSNVSWRTALDWKLAPAQLLYLSVSRGYKNGSFPTAGATRYTSLTPAVQESLLAYEAGFKLGLLNRTMQVNGAVFYYDYDNKQIRGRVLDPVIGPLNALVNIPHSRVYGADLQVDWQPINALRLNAAATYTNSEITDNFTNYNALGQLGDFGGERFPFTPQWQVNADAEYRHAVRSLQGFLGASGHYQSDSNAGLGDLGIFDIKAYTTLDLRAGVRAPNDAWSVMAYVKNVTNEYYWNSVVNVIDSVMRYTDPPRTWGVALSFRY
jgi:iron complex outermembrane recepter protein